MNALSISPSAAGASGDLRRCPSGARTHWPGSEGANIESHGDVTGVGLACSAGAAGRCEMGAGAGVGTVGVSAGMDATSVCGWAGAEATVLLGQLHASQAIRTAAMAPAPIIQPLLDRSDRLADTTGWGDVAAVSGATGAVAACDCVTGRGIGRGAGRCTIWGAICGGGLIPMPRGIFISVSGGIRKGVMRAILGASAGHTRPLTAITPVWRLEPGDGDGCRVYAGCTALWRALGSRRHSRMPFRKCSFRSPLR